MIVARCVIGVQTPLKRPSRSSECAWTVAREHGVVPQPLWRPPVVAKLVLIADDDENDAFAISQTLARAGIKNLLKTVSDGAEVIAYFRGDGRYADRKKFPLPSVLLLDLKMRKIGGFAVLEWLNAQRPARNGTLVVLVSGYCNDENLRRACSLGVHSFFIKPCTVRDIKTQAQAYPSYWQTDGTRESLRCASEDSRTGGASAGASK